jgi:hypothetical protein
MKVGVMADFSGSNQVFQEEPVGVKDGVNRLFNLKNEPMKDTELVFKNGMMMRKGTDNDYVLNGKDILFAEAPGPFTVIVVNYKFFGG